MSSNNKHHKDLGFTVPENYFSTTKQNILDKVALENKSNSNVLFLKDRKIIWTIAVAASLFIGFLLINPFATNNSSVLAEEDVLMAVLVTDDVDVLLDDYISNEFLTEEIFSE